MARSSALLLIAGAALSAGLLGIYVALWVYAPELLPSVLTAATLGTTLLGMVFAGHYLWTHEAEPEPEPVPQGPVTHWKWCSRCFSPQRTDAAGRFLVHENPHNGWHCRASGTDGIERLPGRVH